MFGEVLHHAAVEALCNERVGYHVREAGEGEKVVRFAGAEERVAELHAVQEVDVVVRRAVNDE